MKDNIFNKVKDNILKKEFDKCKVKDNILKKEFDKCKVVHALKQPKNLLSWLSKLKVQNFISEKYGFVSL